jgi:Holin of 3TMs, for gene-transfer release
MADVASIVGAAAAGANPVTAVVGLGKDLIDKFIPDPQAKAAAQAHLLDLQAQMQAALIDQQNKIIAATSANIKDDHYMQFVRAFFSISMIVLYIWNYAVCRFFQQPPIDIPTSMHAMFATVILGFVGIPAGIDATKKIMAMPGDSQVNVLGVKIGNKS